MQLNNIIRMPITTEKSVNALKANVYAFKVAKQASKGAIAKAVNNLFGVDAIDVRTAIIPGKKKRRKDTKRMIFIKAQAWKKAYVTVRDGQKIEMISEGGSN